MKNVLVVGGRFTGMWSAAAVRAARAHGVPWSQLQVTGEAVRVLRKEFTVGRPAHIPDVPTHASLKVEKEAQR